MLPRSGFTLVSSTSSSLSNARGWKCSQFVSDTPSSFSLISAWGGPSQRIQSFTNCSNMHPSHRLQFFKNCSSMSLCFFFFTFFKTCSHRVTTTFLMCSALASSGTITDLKLSLFVMSLISEATPWLKTVLWEVSPDLYLTH